MLDKYFWSFIYVCLCIITSSSGKRNNNFVRSRADAHYQASLLYYNQLLSAQTVMRDFSRKVTAQPVKYNFHATFNFLSLFGGFAGYFTIWSTRRRRIMVNSTFTCVGHVCLDRVRPKRVCHNFLIIKQAYRASFRHKSALKHQVCAD